LINVFRNADIKEGEEEEEEGEVEQEQEQEESFGRILMSIW
jgi:predicted transcriptional regulator